MENIVKDGFARDFPLPKRIKGYKSNMEMFGVKSKKSYEGFRVNIESREDPFDEDFCNGCSDLVLQNFSEENFYECLVNGNVLESVGEGMILRPYLYCGR